jgi:hypothetical protein
MMNPFMTKKRNNELLDGFQKDGKMILGYLDTLVKENNCDDQTVQNFETIKTYIKNVNVYMSGLQNGMKKVK